LSQTQQLYRLQTLDTKIDQAKQKLAEVKAQLGESLALIQARQQVAAAQQAYRASQTTQKDLELEVQSLSSKITNHEKLLYGSKALSPKEAANLQDEITSLKRWHGSREELLLETMVETEEKENDLQHQQQALQAIESAWQEGQAALGLQREALLREIEALQSQRPTLTELIPGDQLAHYQDLRGKKAGVAVAGVRDNLCQSCGIMVSSNKVRQARSGSELMHCGTCGRILHIL
jgi:hypothetical protein